jgi:hypothetical protein
MSLEDKRHSKEQKEMKKIILLAVALLTATALLVPFGSRGTGASARALPLPTPAEKPPYTAYKGVTIGMTTSEARTKLGVPKEKSDEQDFFELSDRESVQVYYNAATHTVTAVVVTYTGKLDGVPAAKEIFGEDATVKPDGGIFKMVRYPKAGFWISYNKTGGDDPMVMIAMQKM